MASKFSKNDTVRYFSNSAKREVTGTVTGVATNGVVWVIVNGEEKKVQPEKVTLVSAAPKPQVQKPAVYRWVCLECGKKHNSHACPECGSDERIHNTDADTDPSILLGGTYAE